MQKYRPTPTTTTKSISCLGHLHTQAHAHRGAAALTVLQKPCLGAWYTLPGWGEVLLLLQELSGAKHT